MEDILCDRQIFRGWTAFGVGLGRSQKEGKEHPRGIFQSSTKLIAEHVILKDEPIGAGLFRQQLKQFQCRRHQLGTGRDHGIGIDIPIATAAEGDAQNSAQHILDDAEPAHLHSKGRTGHGQPGNERPVATAATRADTGKVIHQAVAQTGQRIRRKLDDVRPTLGMERLCGEELRLHRG